MNENQQQNLMPNPEEILQFLGLDNISEEEKRQVLEGIMDHFSEVIIDTLTDNLNEAQAADLEKTMTEDPEKAQGMVTELASRVPGLHGKIQLAVKQELDVLKSGYDQINK